ncbi:hypothetical protein [Thermovibrio ammonificans]
MEAGSLTLFESGEFGREVLVEALEEFASLLKGLKVNVDALYPADPFVLPFAVYLSDRSSIPLKSELFLGEESRVLLLFSAVPFEGVTAGYLAEKVQSFRQLFPRSPSVVLVSPADLPQADFLLLRSRFTGLLRKGFLEVAGNYFFWPVEGDFLELPPELLSLAREEAKELHRYRRVLESLKRYEDFKSPLKPVGADAELTFWEKLEKGLLVNPELPCLEPQPINLKFEPLFQVEDKKLSSAVTALLEFLAQTLERHFSTYLAYTAGEVVDREGVLIVPRALERKELRGVELNLEIVLREPKSFKASFKKLLSLVERVFGEFRRAKFKGVSLGPVVDATADERLGKGVLYLSWFIDYRMVEDIYSKVNRSWLVSRLLARKEAKKGVLAFFRFLKEFSFEPGELEEFASRLNGLWGRGEPFFRAKSAELKELLTEKELWPLVAYYAVKGKLVKGLKEFLLSLAGVESGHQLIAKSDKLYFPVESLRLYRSNWERLENGGAGVVLKGELLTGESIYRVFTDDGHYLGRVPQPFSHYLAAAERAGRRFSVRPLSLCHSVFTETSYWLQVQLL